MKTEKKMELGKLLGSVVILLVLLALVFRAIDSGVPRVSGNAVDDLDADSPADEWDDVAQAEDADDWQLRLVSNDYPLEEGYVPETATLPNGLEFDARAIDALTDMLAEGEAEGLQFVVCSAYRSVEEQSSLFEQQIGKQRATGLTDDDAVEAAKTVVTYPGHSEHNLGLAADIAALDYQSLDEGYAETAEAQWLLENCARFGFILRYPADKQEITGIIFEPWHFRYVGVEHAEYIMANGLCLEEYLGVA